MENTTKGAFLVDSQGFSFYSSLSLQEGAASSKGSTAASSAQPSSVQPYTGELSRDDYVPQKTVAAMSYGQRIRVARIYQSHEEILDQVIRVGGWSKSVRKQANMVFIELNDGSCFKNLQVVIDKSAPGFEEAAKSIVGASYMFTGLLIKSPAKGQLFELAVNEATHNVTVCGHSDGSYPIQGRPNAETLREQAHLRPRTNTFGAVTRVRNNLAFATHQFFQQRGFLYIHTPIITASDCEGAGEMFQVTTTLPEPHEPISKAKLQDKLKTPKTAEEIKAQEEEKKAAEEAQAAKDAAEGKKPKKDKKKKKGAANDDHLFNFTPVPLQDQLVDYKKDMFSKPAFLTVSGQLSVETFTVGLADCYTFGPTFRAENSHTSRHLCEFWMIEPELAFATIHDDMECAEDYVRFCLKYVMQNNKDDLEFFDERIEKGLLKRLENVINTPFKKIPYTECVEILMRDIKDKSKKLKFENEVFWGCDLASEHEKYLTDKVFCGPIIVYNYPADIKAFYMKMNEDGKTVQAMDVLVPRIGELIGGSAREDNLEVLDARLDALKLNKEDYWWYRDLRRYGSVPHAGFGLGFERLVMLATGIENIRDVIPFPRAPGQADF